MKKLLVMMCAFAVALMAPVSAFGKSERAQARAEAKQNCKQLRAEAGKRNFRSMFGKNAYGKCVRQERRENLREARVAQRQARQNAAHECKAERAEDRDAFRDTYGSNRSGKNAFGKCVSQKAQENEEQLDAENGEEDENQVNAARLCRAEKREDADAFRETTARTATSGTRSASASRRQRAS